MKTRLVLAGGAAALSVLAGCTSTSSTGGTPAKSTTATASPSSQAHSEETTLVTCTQQIKPGAANPIHAENFGQDVVNLVAREMKLSKEKARKVGITEADIFMTRRVSKGEAEALIKSCGMKGNSAAPVIRVLGNDKEPWVVIASMPSKTLDSLNLTKAEPYFHKGCYEVPGAKEDPRCSWPIYESSVTEKGYQQYQKLWEKAGFSPFKLEEGDKVRLLISTGQPASKPLSR